MPKLVVVVGMPGSGKTHYMEKLKRTREIAAFYDDFQAHTPDKSKNPRHSKHYKQLIDDLRAGKDVAISDIRYCIAKELNIVIASVMEVVPDIKLDVRYFKNDPEACKKNATTRNRATTEIEFELIDRYSKIYVVPHYVTKVMDVHAV